MNRAVLTVLLPIAIAGAFLAISASNVRSVSGKSASKNRKILYYVDPMHPSYRSNKSGTAPDCGMSLEPVYADAPKPSGDSAGKSTAPAGSVKINQDQQQMIGMRVQVAESAPVEHTIRMFGRVAPDEARIYKVVSGMDGVARRVSDATTGSHVKKDEWLATFSAPELRAPLQGYIVSLDVADQQRQGGMLAPEQVKAAKESVQQALDRLLYLGLSQLQLKEIMRTRDVPTDLQVYSPAEGFVLARNMTPGQRFDKGAEWYRIADLSRVWIQADVYSEDAPYIHAGASAMVKIRGNSTMAKARVSEVLPEFDAGSRTLKVRLEMANAGFAFRPEMFVDVELPISLSSSVFVPADAVLDSGVEKRVFVDRGQGAFEPRQVETGWRFDDRVQIVRGLSAGETVVTSANFLLDSESRMRESAAPKTVKRVKDAVCGMELGSGPTKYKSDFGGAEYAFCSASCQKKFLDQPEKYAPAAMDLSKGTGK